MGGITVANSGISAGFWNSLLQKQWRKAGVFGILALPSNEIKKLYLLNGERRADDFAIKHTSSKKELLAVAQWFDEFHAYEEKNSADAFSREWHKQQDPHPQHKDRAEKFRKAAELIAD